MNLDFTLLIILALGIFLGLLISNKGFRVKFFVGFRHFIAGLGQSQRARGGGKAQKRPHPDEVRHRYIQDHHLVKCLRCGGTGRVLRKTLKLLGDAIPLGGKTERCPDCEGTGKVYD